MSKEAFEFFKSFSTSHNLDKAQDTQWHEACRIMCLLMRDFREHRNMAGYGHAIHETARYISFLNTCYPQVSYECLQVTSTYNHKAYLEALKTLAEKLYDVLQDTIADEYDDAQYPLYTSLPMPFADVSARYHFFELKDRFQQADGSVAYEELKGFVSTIDTCWSNIVEQSRKMSHALGFIEEALDKSIANAMQDTFSSHVWLQEKQLCIRIRWFNERIKYAKKNRLSYSDLKRDLSEIEQMCFDPIDLWGAKDGTHYLCSSVIDCMYAIARELDAVVSIIG